MIFKTVSFTKLDDYEYMPIDSKAIVRINKFVEEQKDEDSNTSYVYETSEITVDSDIITEAMVKSNPIGYWEYDDTVTQEERISALEDALLEIIGG